MKKKILLAMVVVLAATLSGCNAFKWFVGNIKEELVGRELALQTYDEDSQLIDRVIGNSISIKPDDKFSIESEDGGTVSKSAVLNITVGGKEMLHVGSSLIAYDTDLENIFEDYIQQVDVTNFDKSVPFVNRMVNDLKNYTTGKDKIILIRSQSGKPLATFAGDKVSHYGSDIDKATGLQVDGKYLFIYRCDYTIYETSMLQN